MYHLEVNGKRVTDLRLSGATIAKIFTGGVTNWSDAAITADAASARVVVLNCHRSNIGAVSIRSSTTPWALLDGQVESIWAIRAWGLVTGTTGALQRGVGVTSGRVSPGIYQLTWTTPFAAGTDYAVVASSLGQSILATSSNQTGTGCTMRLFNASTGANVDSDFGVQVTGVRL